MHDAVSEAKRSELAGAASGPGGVSAGYPGAERARQGK